MASLEPLHKLTQEKTKCFWISLSVIGITLFFIASSHDSFRFISYTKDIHKTPVPYNPAVSNAPSIPFHDPVTMGEQAVLEAQSEYNKQHFHGNRGFHKHVPHCTIVGVRKAGTRALLEFLHLHPDLAIRLTETHFFEYNETYYRGLDYYLKKMPVARGNQIVVTKRPRYFLTPYVPERMQRMNASMKIIVVVRDPVKRMVSEYVHFDLLKGNDATFESLALLPNGKVNSNYRSLKNSKYYYNFKHWLNYFPRNQIHIVNGDQLIHDPFPEVEKVETFLGVRHAIKNDQLFYDDEKGFYCYYVKNKKGKQKKQCLGGAKGRPHPEVKQEVLDKLSKHLKRYNEMFYNLVGERFDW